MPIFYQKPKLGSAYSNLIKMAEVQTKVHRPKSGASEMQPPLFKNPILERFSRTHISIPLAIFAIISSGVFYYGVTEIGLTGTRLGVFYVAGVLTFTLIEYLAHRFVYHMEPDKKWKEDFSPIDEMGITFVDTEYSKAYLKHLFSVNELLGKQIATIHNLGFYLWLTRQARKHILAGDFGTWKTMMVKQMDNRL